MSFGLVQADGTVERVPYAPDLPTFPEQYERIHGKVLAGEDLTAYRAINAIWNQASKAMFLPTETPDEIVAAWHQAFEDIRKDPEFIEAAAAKLGPAQLVVGDAARPIIASAVKLSDATIKQLNDALKASRFTYQIK